MIACAFSGPRKVTPTAQLFSEAVRVVPFRGANKTASSNWPNHSFHQSMKRIIRALYGLAAKVTVLVAALYDLFHFFTAIFATR
jgi:hypothetical protein